MPLTGSSFSRSGFRQCYPFTLYYTLWNNINLSRGKKPFFCYKEYKLVTCQIGGTYQITYANVI